MSPTRGARTRAAVVAAARRAFAEEGWEGATGARIAAEVGVSEPTIAFHFGNKAGLLVAVLHDWYDELHVAMDAVLDTEQDPLRRLEAFACWWLEHNAAHIELLSVFAEKGRSRDGGEVAVAFHEANRRVTRAFDRLVDDAKRAGLVRAEVRTRIVRDAFFGGAEHVMVGRATSPRAVDLAAAAADLLELLLAGASPRQDDATAVDIAEVDGKLDEVLSLLRAGQDA